MIAPSHSTARQPRIVRGVGGFQRTVHSLVLSKKDTDLSMVNGGWKCQV